MPSFEKVGECLYRYTPTGTYYARFESSGREVRRSLDTTDRALAKRRLADLQRSIARTVRGGGKITLAQLCDRYLSTTRNQAAATIYRKEAIARRIKNDWPGGADVPISKVVTSHVSAWLASYDFGVPSYNLHLLFVRAALDLAVADHLLADSPAAGLKIKQAKKPVRKTPSFEEFLSIVAAIRAQVYNAEATDSGDFVEFIGLAGLGQAEAGALTWAKIDWDKAQITTFRQKTSRGFVIPLYPPLRPVLDRMRQERGGSPPGGEKVFRVKDAKKAITAACKRLRLPAYSHRSFRRMFITRALERGIDVKTVSLWQGHRDGGKLILDTYSHVNAIHAERMAKLME
jgi:integrase